VVNNKGGFMQRHKLLGIVVALAILISSTLAIATANYYEAKTQQQTVLRDVAAQALGGNYNINWNVVSGGGNTMSSASYTLKSTVGQPVVGNFSGTNYNIANGFWQNVFNKLKTFLPIIDG
jgi:hypothetical protein